MSSQLKSIGFFILCFTFGLSVFFSFQEGIVTQRDPASIGGKIFQISSLSSDQIKNQLIQKIKVFPTVDGKKSIQFSGFSSGLCKTYSEIEMEFQAEGVATAGEVPTMKISSPCEIGQDPSEMASFLVPVSKILNEKPRNAEYKFEGFSTKISFNHAADEWPRQWVLKTVHFKNTAGEVKSANFDRKPATERNSDRPVVLEF